MANPFDQFDQPAAGGNPFDRFDAPAKESAKPAAALGWSDVPGQAVKNLLPSAGNFLSGIGHAIAHPLDTVGNVADIGAGALRNALPARLVSAIDSIDPNPASAQRASQAASATGQFFKDRYGSMEGVKNTLATDPVGAASDLSTVLTGGAGLLRLGGKGVAAAANAAGRTAPGVANAMTSAADAVGKAGELTNPVAIASHAASIAGPALGNAAAHLVGGLGTHTGAESMKSAFDAGRRGGSTAKTLADNMRGNVPMTDVLDNAKADIAEMGRIKSEAYRQNMAAVNADKSVLSFDGIDNAVNDAFRTATFKGQVKNTKAAQVQQEIAAEVANWKSLDPAEFHTPEGLDALKQKIGGIVETVPFEQKTARMIGDKVYNAIKAEIVKQAPVYADTMKAYSEATDQIREIERALSLGKKASIDTAMRKLQSLTRNNVNTNYGNRLSLAQQLEQQGGREIMPALAGQALSSWTPRGLGGAVAAPSGIAGYSMGGPLVAAGVLAAQSPRLMGEAALGAGRVAGGVERAARPAMSLMDAAGLDPAITLNSLYQAGRLPR